MASNDCVPDIWGVTYRDKRDRSVPNPNDYIKSSHRNDGLIKLRPAAPAVMYYVR